MSGDHINNEIEKSLISLPNLSVKIIRHILGLIDEEIARTFNDYGQSISPNDAVKEKIALLVVFNWLGGSHETKNDLATQKSLLFAVYLNHALICLKEQARYYFQQLRFGSGSKLWYHCHLESVISRILDDVANGEI